MASYSNSDSKLLAQFGARLHALRTQKGYSQEELAEKAGLHRTYVGSAERGERNVSLINLRRLAEALGVKTEQLVRLESG